MIMSYESPKMFNSPTPHLTTIFMPLIRASYFVILFVQGNIILYDLGNKYLYGIEVEPNSGLGLVLLEQAANGGSKLAQNDLGFAFLGNYGQIRSIPKLMPMIKLVCHIFYGRN